MKTLFPSEFLEQKEMIIQAPLLPAWEVNTAL